MLLITTTTCFGHQVAIIRFYKCEEKKKAVCYICAPRTNVTYRFLFLYYIYLYNLKVSENLAVFERICFESGMKLRIFCFELLMALLCPFKLLSGSYSSGLSYAALEKSIGKMSQDSRKACASFSSCARA
jgi:hypothetical protein